MATIHSGRAHAASMTRGEPDNRVPRAENAGLLFGAAVAISICFAEVFFFCAYLVALPVMAVMALFEIPQWVRKHVQMR